MKRRALWVWAFAVVAAPAAAQERPQFVLIDQQTGPSRIGLDASLIFPKDVEAYGIRFDAYAQFVTRSHFGGYMRLGVTHLKNQGITESDLAPSWQPVWPDHKLNSPTAGTNIEVGGMYVLGLPGYGLDLVFHVGGVIPTGPRLTDWNALANLFTGMGRITDYEQVAPGMGWIRGGVIASGAQGRLFYQVDVSGSVGFSKDDEMDSFGVFHANVAVGGHFGVVSLVGELANMVTISSFEDPWAHAASAGVIFQVGEVQPRISYVLPFDSDGVMGNVVLVGFTWAVGRMATPETAAAEDD